MKPNCDTGEAAGLVDQQDLNEVVQLCRWICSRGCSEVVLIDYSDSLGKKRLIEVSQALRNSFGSSLVIMRKSVEYASCIDSALNCASSLLINSEYTVWRPLTDEGFLVSESGSVLLERDSVASLVNLANSQLLHCNLVMEPKLFCNLLRLNFVRNVRFDSLGVRSVGTSASLPRLGSVCW